MLKIDSLINKVGRKLRKQSMTHLSLAGGTSIVNHVLMPLFWNFIIEWMGSWKVLCWIKALLRSCLWSRIENIAQAQFGRNLEV